MFNVFDVDFAEQVAIPATCKMKKPCVYKPTPVQKEEETTPMFDTKRYLRDRIEDTWLIGKKELARKFNLIENDHPNTAKELVDRIKSDQFTLPTMDEDGITAYGTGPFGLIWRSPDKVADRKGYEEAAKVLLETKRDTVDVILALPEQDGLKALQDFKATVKALNS